MHCTVLHVSSSRNINKIETLVIARGRVLRCICIPQKKRGGMFFAPFLFFYMHTWQLVNDRNNACHTDKPRHPCTHVYHATMQSCFRNRHAKNGKESTIKSVVKKILKKGVQW